MHPVHEFTVETIFESQEVRLTAWNLQGEPSLCLHLHESADEPSLTPNDPDSSEFWSGIALQPDAARRLARALLLAADNVGTESAA